MDAQGGAVGEGDKGRIEEEMAKGLRGVKARETASEQQHRKRHHASRGH
jgi:hypothetical protein